MTYLGTRPPTVDEYEQYEIGHRKRLAMKPGLTGMWQVSGRSDITDFDEVVALDAKYIEQWDILPARVRKPKDKPNVEGSVRQCWLMI